MWLLNISIILLLTAPLFAGELPFHHENAEILPVRGEYQSNPNRIENSRGVDVTMSNLVGIPLTSNFGGWTYDYFMEMYVPAADGFVTSIDFNFSDLPDIDGGGMSIWIYEANYPWDEINTEDVADGCGDANLGYYDEATGYENVGTNWVKGGINAVEGADADFNYDPLGAQGWPAFGSGSMSVPPNADDRGWLNFDLVGSMGTTYDFTRDVPFIVVVRFTGFPDGADAGEYRMGFLSGTKHINPQPTMKFYSTISSPIGRCGTDDWGWYIRSYVWDWDINATLTGDRGPEIDMEKLVTTLSTSARTVTAIITDDNPSGGAAGVASASLIYTLDNGDAQGVTMSPTGNSDEYAAAIPGQYPGSEVTYWIEATDVAGNATTSSSITYEIFEPLEPTLFVYDDNALSVDTAAYYYTAFLNDTIRNHYDVWEAKFGPVTEVLLSNYEIVYHVMGGGPINDASSYSTVYSLWLSNGSELCPRRLFMSGQDYNLSSWGLLTFPVGSFEYDYLGIETIGPLDVNYDGTKASYTQPYAINAVAGDTTTGFLLEYAGDSLQMFYDPYREIGFNNWIDNFTPTSSATVCLTDPNNNDAAVAVYNSGEGWRTAFWALDPLAINYYSPIDTSSMYHWALTTVGNPVAATFEWFGSPHNLLVDVDNGTMVPEKFKLYANYPNPFNPSTTIRYELPEQSTTTLNIYDIQGRTIQTLVSDSKPAGHYEAQWNGTDRDGKQVAAGMYFARLSTGDFTQVVKMVYLR